MRQAVLSLACCGLLAAQPPPVPTLVHAASRVTPLGQPAVVIIAQPVLDPAFAPGSLVQTSTTPFVGGSTPTLMGSDGVRRRLEIVASANPPASRWFDSPVTYRIPLGVATGSATLGFEAFTLPFLLTGATSPHPNRGPEEVRIVPRRFELFDTGHRAEGEPIRMSRPATAGQRITLEGTGLGLLPGEASITVHLGSTRVRPAVTSAPDAPGVDRLEFILPAAATPGCFVPLSVEVDGEMTRLSRTLPVALPGQVCPELAGISREDIAAIEAGLCVPALYVNAGGRLWTSGGRTRDLSVFGNQMVLPTTSEPQPAANGSCTLTRSRRNSVPFPGNLIPALRLPGHSCQSPSLGAFSLLDAQGRSSLDLLQQSPFTPAPAPTVLESRLQSGDYRLRTSFGDFALPLIQLRWLNRLEGGTLTLDRDYTVLWDTTATRPGDRVDLRLSAWQNREGFTISCAAEATRGALTLPAWLLREVSTDFTGASSEVRLEMTRPTDFRKLDKAPYRYLVIENRSSEERSIVLP